MSLNLSTQYLKRLARVSREIKERSPAVLTIQGGQLKRFGQSTMIRWDTGGFFLDLAPRDDDKMPLRLRWLMTLGRSPEEDIDYDAENPAQNFRQRTIQELQNSFRKDLGSSVPLLMGRSRMENTEVRDTKIFKLPTESDAGFQLKTTMTGPSNVKAFNRSELILPDYRTQELTRIQPLNDTQWNYLVGETVDAWVGNLS